MKYDLNLLYMSRNRFGLWRLMSLSTIFHLSWWALLLVEETRVPGENHRPVATH
jgi:hypothetical protein